MPCVKYSYDSYAFECLLCGYVKKCRNEKEFNTSNRLHYRVVHKRNPPKKNEFEDVITFKTYEYTI